MKVRDVVARKMWSKARRIGSTGLGREGCNYNKLNEIKVKNNGLRSKAKNKSPI